jgi:hypothetical protein
MSRQAATLAATLAAVMQNNNHSEGNSGEAKAKPEVSN